MREFDLECSAIIPEMLLMEDAGRLMAEEIFRELRRKDRGSILFLAGPGHNGGDALVAARHLSLRGISSRVFLTRSGLRDLTEIMLNSLDPQFVSAQVLPEGEWEPLFSALDATADDPESILVDGWLGSGITRPIDSESDRSIGELIRRWNQARATRIALDVPSGLADNYDAAWPVFQADITLAVQYPRRMLYTEPARGFCGEIRVIRPGFPGAVRRAMESKPRENGLVSLMDGEDLPSLIEPMDPAAHKSSRGRIAVYGGAPGTEGAAVLAARAAAKSGAGMVRIYSPHDSAAPAMLSEDPSLMHAPIEVSGSSALPITGGDIWADVLVIGPGLADFAEDKSGAIEMEYQQLLDYLLHLNLPTVLDASALRLLARALGTSSGPGITKTMNEAIRQRTAPLILTPHPGEAAELSEMTVAEVLRNPEKCCRTIAKRLGDPEELWIILKSSVSWIFSKENGIWILDGREPSLGTAGSGDVLSGVTGALIARIPDPDEALPAAVLAHYRAGIRCHRRRGLYTAAELVDELGRVFGELNFFDRRPK
jgi:hydroxyethylthiazole kinase-like uncharacterized protein yjeF